jgi:hypothetical protein
MRRPTRKGRQEINNKKKNEVEANYQTTMMQ